MVASEDNSPLDPQDVPDPQSPDPEPLDDGDDDADGIVADYGFGALAANKQRAIIGLLNQATVNKAAAAAGVGQRTLHRWLDDPTFRSAYHKARREAYSQAIGLTQRYAPLAVNTLAKVMADPKTPPHAKVTAAATLLKFGREGIELDDLAMRVEVLEQAAEISGRSPGAHRWAQPTSG